MKDRPTCLYRLIDEFDRRLYVGISRNLPGRLSKHARRPWWPDVVEIREEWFSNREAALWAERHAIRDENPTYNIVRPRVECC